ncbi:MAG: DUF11 domain-containing protein [Anaerolineae bacterium]|nr:DUF11 domain-containing protein [Anaerolineae bacterium]
MKKRLHHAASLFGLLLTVFGPVMAVRANPLLQGGNCVLNGSAYRDFNADGERTSAQEVGVADILVTAYDASGNAIDSATTDDTGAYSLTALPAAEEVRLEFTSLPSYLYYGPAGAGSSTSVAFVTCGTNQGTIDIGVANPGQYCDLTPDIVTTCFTIGDQAGNNEPVLVSVPYTAGSTDLTSQPVGGRFDGSNTYLATADDIGSNWGIAYRRQSNLLYTAAYLKRHAGFGPDGPGAIYAVNPGGGASLLTTLPAAANGEALHTDGTPYADRPTFNPWLIDSEAYNLVGKRSLGGMTISDDDNTLYVVNLFDRSLYAIPVDDPGSATSFAIPTSLPNCPSANDARPFAVEFQDGLAYVGITCSAESSQSQSDLRGYVYTFDPTSSAFSLVFDFPLNYGRGCVNGADDPTCNTVQPAEWLPWIAETNPPTWPLDFSTPDTVTYPQPMFSSIDFDNNGDLLIGLRDRWGDMGGNYALSVVAGDTELYGVITAGDILRACLTSPGNWSLEGNGSCGSVTTGGSGNTGQGPGSPGGEYYYQDNLIDFHDELSLGSLLQVSGQTDMVATVFDPIPISSQLFDGGFRWMDNQSGQTARAYRIYDGAQGSPTLFGKANGLGGIAALCPPAPIEIGNRVWFDVDGDGVQDADEPAVTGVTVSLYDAGGGFIGQVVTNSQGEYLFSSQSFALEPGTNYVLRMDNPADFAANGPLDGWFLTANNTDESQRDSDAVLTGGIPQISLATGGFGDNDHTFDFGFTQAAPEAALQLVKSVDNPQAQAGDTVVYTYVVTNIGQTEIVIDELIDDQLGPITVSPTTLQPGDSATGTSQPVTLQADALPLTNIAVVNGRRTDTNEPLTDTDTVTVGESTSGGGTGGSTDGSTTNVSTGSPSFRKSVNPPFAQVGDTVTWTITVSNTTDAAISNVSVTDTMPNGLEILSVSSSSGNVSYSGQTVTFTMDSLAPGHSVTISIVTRVVSSDAFILDNQAFFANLNQTASARLVLASELVRTGEVPWWRTPLIALTLVLVAGAGYEVVRRRTAA